MRQSRRLLALLVVLAVALYLLIASRTGHLAQHLALVGTLVDGLFSRLPISIQKELVAARGVAIGILYVAVIFSCLWVPVAVVFWLILIGAKASRQSDAVESTGQLVRYGLISAPVGALAGCCIFFIALFWVLQFFSRS